jgi:hypothetical protein
MEMVRPDKGIPSGVFASNLRRGEVCQQAIKLELQPRVSRIARPRWSFPGNIVNLGKLLQCLCPTETSLLVRGCV